MALLNIGKCLKNIVQHEHNVLIFLFTLDWNLKNNSHYHLEGIAYHRSGTIALRYKEHLYRLSKHILNYIYSI